MQMAKVTEDSFALDFHSMSVFQVSKITLRYSEGLVLLVFIGVLSGTISLRPIARSLREVAHILGDILSCFSNRYIVN
jgi:hypothetical protein